MAKGLNEVNLIGNVGNAPEVRRLEGGAVVASFSVATSETYTTNSNEKKTLTQWHRIVVWGKLAEIVEKFVRKGERVFIKGKLTYREYEAQEGKRQITEIVLNDLILLSGTPQQEQKTGFHNVDNYPSFSNDQNNDLPF